MNVFKVCGQTLRYDKLEIGSWVVWANMEGEAERGLNAPESNLMLRSSHAVMFYDRT